MVGGTTDIADEPIIDALFNLLLVYSELLNRQIGFEASINEIFKSDRVTKTQFLL